LSDSEEADANAEMILMMKYVEIREAPALVEEAASAIF
jgi:hypothetical protein